MMQLALLGICLNKKWNCVDRIRRRGAATVMEGPCDVTVLLPLTQLHPGQSAVVGQVMGRPDEVHRLEELGLRSGAAVEMVQSGSPCIIRLSGSKLCFRGTDAFRVLVALGDEA